MCMWMTAAIVAVAGCEGGAQPLPAGPGADAPPVAPAPLWSDGSRHVEIACGSFWTGSMRFVADHDQLTSAERDLLGGLRLVDADSGCILDATACTLSITGPDDQTVSYDANDSDAGCAQSKKLIAFDSLSPLLAVLPCRYAKQSATSATPPGPLGPDARCMNGLFAPAGGGTIDVDVAATTAGEVRTIELDDCASAQRAGRASAQLRATGATAPLAVGSPVADPGAAGACQRIDVTFPAAGTYTLSVTVTSDFLPGDFYLRYR
jgi:hypothetical protein